MGSTVVRWRGAALASAACGALTLGGCSTTGLGGGASLSSSSPPAPAAVVPAALPADAAPAPVAYGAFLGGPAGTRLPEADRIAALGAEDGAVASGERRTWKGARGVFGFVVPGAAAPAAAGGECRTFTHTIYFAGRPETGRGTGCRGADGSWHVTS